MGQDNRLTYEEQLRQKLEEYRQAEAEGLSRAQLMELYKQIKDLQLKAITSSAHYSFWSRSDNTSLYNL